MRLYIRYIKLVILICSGFTFLYETQIQSQSVNSVFDRVTIKDGLSQSTVNDILQDRKGFMWFATYGGISKYDGYTFTSYIHDENDSTTLNYNGIVILYEDKDDFIWCVSNDNTGLDRFDPETEKFTHFSHNPDDPLSISSNTIYHVLQDKEGRLWASTMAGLDLVTREKTNDDFKTSFKTFKLPVHSQPFTHMFEDSRGNMLMFSDSLVYFDRKQQIFIKSNIFITSSKVIVVCEDKSGTVYVGTNTNGVVKLEWNNSISAYQLADNSRINPTPQNRTYLLMQDDDILWIGTETRGLFRYDLKTDHLENFVTDKLDTRSISDNIVNALYIDRSGVLWIGTYSQGLCKYDLYRKEFVHFKSIPGKANTMLGNVISGIHSISSEELWVANRDGGGVNRFIFSGNDEPQVIHYLNNPNNSNSIAGDNPLCLIQRKNGDVWVGNQGFLSVITPETPGSGRSALFKRYTMQGWTFEMFEDSRGVLWGGTWSGGLWRYDDNTGEFNYFFHDPNNPNSICDNVIWALGEDNQGNIWIGGHTEGLSIIPVSEKTKAHPKFINYTHIKGDSKSLTNNTINVFCQDKEGNMWVGTNEGLCKVIYNERTFRNISGNKLIFSSYYKKNGLPNDAVVGIIEGNDNCLWMSTSMGISRYSKADSSFVNYDENDGLQSNEFWHNAFFVNPEGRIFFGGANGFNAFYPNQIKPNPFTPNVVFTDLKIFSKSVKPGERINKQLILSKPLYRTKGIVLSYKNNAFTIEFAALHYTQPVKNHYAYRLEGFEKKWNYVGNQRSATYTNLSAGKYVLKVKGTNNDGVWSNDLAELIIRVRPPWWRTWWVRVIMLFAIAYGIYTYIMRRIKAEQRDKAILQTKIEEGSLELKKRQDEIDKQKKDIQNKEIAAMEINWFNKGMTMAMDIISRNSRNLNELASKLINVMVEYVGVDVGAFYILNKSVEDAPFFEIAGSYAMNQINTHKKIPAEEGYLGVCYKEKNRVIIDNLPEEYIRLESGLGSISLNNLVLIPLILEQNLKGVIELASMEKLPEYKLNLLDRLAENLASSIEIVQMNSRMKSMVDQVNMHMEEVNAQKEEMLQNLEEMRATQEESGRIREVHDGLEKKLTEKEAIIQSTREELKKLQLSYNELLIKLKRTSAKE
jgi:ligand-binding sensor domain-containing protein